MKKTLAAVSVSLLFVAGCNKPDQTPTPTPVPSEAVSESTANPDPTTVEPTDEPKPTEPRETQEPTRPRPSSVITSSDAGTPATQFASRWGKKYPDVPVYVILKTANAVCDLTVQYGNGWEDNPLAKLAIQEAVKLAGLDGNDGVDFALDAQQNYCSSRESAA